MNIASLILAAFLGVIAVAATPEPVTNVFESATPPVVENRVDQLVFDGLAKLNLKPVLCSDAVFVRRVYLDLLGTLPTADEAREFIDDTRFKTKRQVLIEQLLERDEFADYWAMRWGDILRIKAEFPMNLWPNAAQAYHRWVRASLATNKPYDQFARELLTSSGSNFRVGPVNFYRAIQNRTPEGIATAVALTFMGSRAESWPTNQLAGMAAFFAQVGYKPTREWKEEIVFWDPLHSTQWATNDASELAVQPPVISAPQQAVFPDGTRIELPANRDPREIFADWLMNPKNPWFARSIVNRVWYWLLGRGIIQQPDDIRPDNPPSNPELLTYLEQEFIASHYDLKHLYTLILKSSTYQLSSMPDSNETAAAHFASYPLRRLDAEVLIDAINKITGSTDLYTSAIPEPFTYIPEDKPAIALPDGSITSPFLALFGRSARATGLESERNNKPVPAQGLHLLNSSHIQRKIEQSARLKQQLQSGNTPRRILDELYLTILSRFPTPEEIKTAVAYSNSGVMQNPAPNQDARRAAAAKRREDWIDIAWALINSTEFLYRH